MVQVTAGELVADTLAGMIAIDGGEERRSVSSDGVLPMYADADPNGRRFVWDDNAGFVHRRKSGSQHWVGRYRDTWADTSSERTFVAVKFYLSDDADRGENERQLMRELGANVLVVSRHSPDHIRWSDGTFLLLMEWMPGGTLRDELHRGIGFDRASVVRMGFSLIGSLQWVHGKGRAFGDVAPENMFLMSRDADAYVKFGDLDRIQRVGDTNLRGREAYRPPRADATAAEADAYALGVALWELDTGSDVYAIWDTGRALGVSETVLASCDALGHFGKGIRALVRAPAPAHDTDNALKRALVHFANAQPGMRRSTDVPRRSHQPPFAPV
jgi:serine/threonine protein kinase